MQAVTNLPSAASQFVLSAGERAISYIPASVSHFGNVAISKSGAFLASPTTQRAVTGVTLVLAGLVAIAAVINKIVLPIIKRAYSATCSAATWISGKTSSARSWTFENASKAITYAKSKFTPKETV